MWFALFVPVLCGVVLSESPPIIPLPETLDDSPCPDGYDVFSTTCVKVHTDKKLTWKRANKCCQDESSFLVEIKSAELNKFIADRLTSGHRYWIGIKKIGEDFKYSNSGEALTDFHPWAPRQPNNYRNKEKCVEMIGNKKGTWNDSRCSKKRSFICQHPKRMHRQVWGD